MAQQVTNNSLILDSLATTQNSYVDSSVAKFDSVLDVANKTFTKQNDLLNNATSNDTVANISTATTVMNNNSVVSNNSSSVDTSTKTNVVDTDTTVVDTNSASASSSNSTTNSQTQVSDSTSETTNSADETEETVNQDVVVSVADVVSKYACLDDLTVNVDDNVETVEEVVDTTVSETEDVENTLVVDEDSLEDVPDMVDTSKLTENLANVTTSVVGNQVSNTNIDANVDDTDSVMVKVSDNLLSKEDANLLNTEKNVGKDLISQKMVEDLNITIEDISDSQIENVSDDSTLMDSTEQAVKYMMDKETATGSDVTVEPDVEIKNADTKNVVLKDTSLQTKEVAADMTVVDSSEVTEDLVVDTELNNDNKLASDSVSSDTSSDLQDVESVADDVDSTMEENNSSSDENAQGETQDDNVKAEDKSELKKNFFTSSVSEDVEPVDTQADTNNMQTVETVSVHKVHSQRLTMTVGTQTTASASNQVNISKEDVLAQIHSKLQMMNSTSNAKLTMVLNPESLGKVSIQLINTKDGLTAELQVASQTVKDILDSNLSNLKDTLSAQGVQVNDMSVKVSQSENNADMDYTEQEGNGGNKQEQDKRHQEQEKEKEFEKMFSKFQNDEEQEIEG